MLFSKLVRPVTTKTLAPQIYSNCNNGAGIVLKRWSGHNAMEITPSNFDYRFGKNTLHFWFLVGGIPLAIVSAIIDIRANPELSEIPEGYEPRHWEYYKHPVARWMAKTFFTPAELDYEVRLASYDYLTETRIMKQMHRQIKKTMQFYNDHRSANFLPYHGENIRIARDTLHNRMLMVPTKENVVLEDAYDPKVNDVAPTVGMQVDITDK